MTSHDPKSSVCSQSGTDIPTDKSYAESPSFLIVIVLYGRTLAECESYRAIHTQCSPRDAVFIYDNSPEAIPDICAYPVAYRHDPSNGGLGKAYNEAAKHASEKGFDWLLLLDQDTIIPAGFLDAYKRAVTERQDLKLFVPTVRLENRQALSPVRMWGKAGITKTAGEYPLSKYLLINSGLCIEVNLFQRAGGYDEAVWLDFADIQFTRKLLHFIKFFGLVPTTATQNFSNEETDPARLERRFRIYLQCAKNCRYQDIEDYLFRQWSIYKHTLALSVRTRSLAFVKLLFKDYIL